VPGHRIKTMSFRYKFMQFENWNERYKVINMGSQQLDLCK
jgi:hypothetical protein